VNECDFRPGEHLADDTLGVITIGDEHAVSDPAVVVIGAHDLLARAQPRG
jgi:hypothetical protein